MNCTVWRKSVLVALLVATLAVTAEKAGAQGGVTRITEQNREEFLFFGYYGCHIPSQTVGRTPLKHNRFVSIVSVDNEATRLEGLMASVRQKIASGRRAQKGLPTPRLLKKEQRIIGKRLANLRTADENC